MNKDLEQWLSAQSAQQTELANVSAGLMKLSLQGVSDLIALNFSVARRQIENAGKNVAVLSTPEQLPSALQKATGEAIGEAQAYLQDSAELITRLNQAGQALVADHFKVVASSAEALVAQTNKLNPAATETVNTALRSWVEGAQSAVSQMQQMSTQFQEFAGNNGALMAWQAAKQPARARTNGKAAS